MTAEMIPSIPVWQLSTEQDQPRSTSLSCAHARLLLPGSCAQGELLPVLVGDLEDAFTGAFCSAHLEPGVASLTRRYRQRFAPPRPSGSRLLLAGETIEQIRQWALGEGLPVSRHGGLSGRIIAAYRSRACGSSA